ncbi:nucleoside kinase, CMP and AMP kinase [Paenibacillus alvei TS-15]|uniref:Nucleoside kinase, CMP and AMP kinase n=1 Tax=Paenibacillus alvei TS-15 TaxID=1117108 RepID=S9SJ34_PAEAL|nr:AAA family ATPase [Paenibacillus alvei]EPY05827.1 nucleoside kinase, CMP and AMP kinase [Paenibacillus alvei TS-15]
MSKLPLFVVTGACGTGKTTVSSLVRKLLPNFDVFDMDIINNVDWQIAKANWLRIAYSISLSGRGTVLCGTMIPENIESADYKDKFDRILYINLHCDDFVREERLKARGWEECLINDHKNFANWLINNSKTAFNPPMPTIDTTELPAEEVAKQIKDWILKNW